MVCDPPFFKVNPNDSSNFLPLAIGSILGKQIKICPEEITTQLLQIIVKWCNIYNVEISVLFANGFMKQRNLILILKQTCNLRYLCAW